jgi:hypothetical protein
MGYRDLFLLQVVRYFSITGIARYAISVRYFSGTGIARYAISVVESQACKREQLRFHSTHPNIAQLLRSVIE